MTQTALAGWLNVTVTAVKHLENERRKASGPVSRLLDFLSEKVKRGGSSKPSNALPRKMPRGARR